jgi:hypothetical protein
LASATLCVRVPVLVPWRRRSWFIIWNTNRGLTVLAGLLLLLPCCRAISVTLVDALHGAACIHACMHQRTASRGLLMLHGVCGLMVAMLSRRPPLLTSGQMGVQTPLHGLFSAVIIVVVLVALTRLFENLPMAVLAAIILMALRGVFARFARPRHTHGDRLLLRPSRHRPDRCQACCSRWGTRGCTGASRRTL